jgi:hypothetical protein
VPSFGCLPGVVAAFFDRELFIINIIGLHGVSHGQCSFLG